MAFGIPMIAISNCCNPASELLVPVSEHSGQGVSVPQVSDEFHDLKNNEHESNEG